MRKLRVCVYRLACGYRATALVADALAYDYVRARAVRRQYSRHGTTLVVCARAIAYRRAQSIINVLAHNVGVDKYVVRVASSVKHPQMLDLKHLMLATQLRCANATMFIQRNIASR